MAAWTAPRRGSRTTRPAIRTRRSSGLAGIRSMECESHVSIARPGAWLSSPACGNHHVLLVVHFVGARTRVAARLELGVPESFAGRLVEGAEFLVLRGGDEHKSPGGNQRSTDVLRAGRRNATRGEFPMFSQDNLPDDAALVQVDRRELSPGRLDGGVTLLIDKAVVAGVRVAIAGVGLGRHERQYPGLVVRIDVEPARRRIEGPAAPVRAAVESRKDDRPLEARRH